MASPSDLFGAKGKNVAEQLVVWAILGQLIGTALGPIFQGLQREINDKLPLTPLSPALLADMVVRAIIDHDGARDYAAQSGINGTDFERMVHNAGESLSPTDMVEAFRRGLIAESGRGPDQTSFEQAIAESRIYNKYGPILLKLADRPIDPAAAVDAAVEGQLGFDEAAKEAFLSGINRDRFQILVNTRGNPPDPTQLAEMVRRNLIPLQGTGPTATTFQQGIFESAWKDKWEPLFEQLIRTVPPARTVTALVRNGSIDDAQALTWFSEAGLNPDAAAAYLADAHHQKTQAQRDLAASTIEQLYTDQFIDRARAVQLLGQIHYSAEDAGLILDLADFKLVQQALTQLRSRLHTLYVAHKLDKQAVIAALDGQGIPGTARDKLLADWDLEREANVKLLTPAEISSAVYYSIIDFDAGVAELVNLGYSQTDAAILIGVRLHGKPPPIPAAG